MLLDKEDEETVVDDSFDAFQAMYEPVILDQFGDVMEIRDGKFFIDNENKATQRRLWMQINDNVHKNLEKFSVTLFDQDTRFCKKEGFARAEKEEIVEQLVENHDRKKQGKLLFDATDRILYAHRNLKLLLFLTSGPFFALLFCVKYSIKFGVLYFLYNKKKKGDE